MSQKAALPAAGGDADPGGSAVDIVGDVGAFGVTARRADAAFLGFGEERMIGQAVFPGAT